MKLMMRSSPWHSGQVKGSVSSPVNLAIELLDSIVRSLKDTLREVFMPQSKSYVRVDKHGAMHVGKSHVMLDSIVAGFEQGYSPETIQHQYPALSLEEVYGAIAWYLANADEVSRYLEHQNTLWTQWRAKAAEHPSP